MSADTARLCASWKQATREKECVAVAFNIRVNEMLIIYPQIFGFTRNHLFHSTTTKSVAAKCPSCSFPGVYTWSAHNFMSVEYHMSLDPSATWGSIVNAPNVRGQISVHICMWRPWTNRMQKEHFWWRINTHMSLSHTLDFNCVLDCLTTSQWGWRWYEVSLQKIKANCVINSF